MSEAGIGLCLHRRHPWVDDAAHGPTDNMRVALTGSPHQHSHQGDQTTSGILCIELDLPLPDRELGSDKIEDLLQNPGESTPETRDHALFPEA